MPTGTANIASVMAAFRRLGAEPRVGREPGRGAAGDRMSCCRASVRSVRRWRAWSSRGWTRRCATRIAADRPTICICVGHQLLFETSDESPGVRGPGRRSGACRPLPGRRARAAVRLERGASPADEARLLEGGYAYFANSYRATEAPGWAVASADAWRPVSSPPWSAATWSAASSIRSCPAPTARRCSSRFLELA